MKMVEEGFDSGITDCFGFDIKNGCVSGIEAGCGIKHGTGSGGGVNDARTHARMDVNDARRATRLKNKNFQRFFGADD